MNSDRREREKVNRAAWVVWIAGVSAYITAVTGRTSFGVAAVDAIDRFSIGASEVAVFTAVQVASYALAQIPTGLALDRWGSRRVVVTGALMMGLGQLILGLSTNYGIAVGARVLIGAGDATAFLAVLRLLPYWFPSRLTPLMTQMTACLGQLGQFLSAVPFLALLHATGWQTAFISLGSITVLVGLICAFAMAEVPSEAGTADRPSLKHSLGLVVKNPTCWQAMLLHSAGLGIQATFTLLWGAPLMSLGMGLNPAQIGFVLSVNTLFLIAASPIAGVISSRMRSRRDLAALTLTGGSIVAWIIFLLSPEPRSLAAIIMLNAVVAFATPASNFGFDTVRENLPRSVVATATGLANMGGFITTMIGAQTIGWILDASAGTAGYTWDSFRLAWSSMIVLWASAAVGILLLRGPIRRHKSTFTA